MRVFYENLSRSPKLGAMLIVFLLPFSVIGGLVGYIFGDDGMIGAVVLMGDI